MRSRVGWYLALALLCAACSPPVPAPDELRSVTGVAERVHVSEKGMGRATLLLRLRGDSARYTTPLPPGWDEPEEVSAACAGAPVSLRVDAKSEIWEISCRGRRYFSYRDKVGRSRDAWDMGTSNLVVAVLVVAGLVWGVLRAQRRRGPE
ncbi:MAG TPA: hypothetical protein VHG28_01920 [Longimicrobiaceae bacterium]|nr:hypothetical protein [Longimicrobiaceae bacterium]